MRAPQRVSCKKQSVPCEVMASDGYCPSPSSCPTLPSLQSVGIGPPVCAYARSGNLPRRMRMHAPVRLPPCGHGRGGISRQPPPYRYYKCILYTRRSNVWITLNHAHSVSRKPRASHVLVVAWLHSGLPCMETAAKTGRSERIREQQRGDRSSRSYSAREIAT